MSTATRTALNLEARKLLRAPVARIAAAAVLALVAVTTVGGYAAAVHAPDTDLGRKAAAMLTAPGWDGYTGLAALSTGVTMLLAAGIVMAWTAGREFTDGTIVGLFAIPPRPSTIAGAKIIVCVAWVVALVTVEAIALPIGALLLGLPAHGVLGCCGALLVTGLTLGTSALPVMWAATRWRGYLAGISATLALVVITNIAAGFGLGTYLPWAVPVLWATPGNNIPTALLAEPIAAAVIGAAATCVAWSRLQLGRN